MSQILWRGYPVAQHQGEEATVYRGHRLEITRGLSRQTWIPRVGWRWFYEWDAYVDDELVTCCESRSEAKQACITHVDQLGDKASV